MATQLPQLIDSNIYTVAVGGTDFSGILANVGIYPVEIFVSVGAPAADSIGLRIAPGEKLPIKIASGEQLYARASGADFPTKIQLA